MKQLIIFLLLLSGPFVFSAEQVALTPKQIERAKVVYIENCMACHGEKGDGKGAAASMITGHKPRDFTTGYFRHGGEPKEIFRTISEGSDGTAMPPWKDALTDDDIWTLVHYVKSFKLNKAK